MKDMEPAKSSLDDPDYAAFAWRRYRRLMAWMILASLGATIGCLVFLSKLIGDIPIHMMIATAAGVFVSVLLASALMGLVFLSSGSGHDDAIRDPLETDDA
jgi:peptidoglycan/LPS O-acetylase OafA/YrhL